MTRWFRSIDAPRDPAWHRSWRGYTFAYCGIPAHPSLPWIDHIAGRHTVICAACEN